MGLMLIAVLSTALIVHASWNWAAGRNVDTVVASLSGQSADAVRRELDATFRAAEGAIEVIRSILFQGAVRTTDEAKREYIFLSVLRSLPAVSWVGFGFPDGRFFGAHAVGEDRIEMVEIGATIAGGGRTLRRDRYRPLPGDVFFEERQMADTAYVTLGQAWYRNALETDAPGWSMVDILPSGFEPAAVVSRKLTLYGRFEGVLMVSINLARLSEFISGLDIAREGVAVILDRNRTVIASSLGNLRSATLGTLAVDAGARERLVRAIETGAGGVAPADESSVYVKKTDTRLQRLGTRHRHSPRGLHRRDRPQSAPTVHRHRRPRRSRGDHRGAVRQFHLRRANLAHGAGTAPHRKLLA